MTEYRRVFLDTAPIIYYLENNAQYKDLIKDFFAKCLKNNVQLVTSAITIEDLADCPCCYERM